MEGILVILSVCFVLSAAQVPGLGPCPKTQPQKHLDLTKYLGKWYELYKLPNLFENKQECVTANYSMKADGHIKVLNSGIEEGKTVFAEGDAYRPDNNNESILSVRFAAGTPYAPYWVLDTDYTSYSLVFSCEQLGSFAHVKFLWLLSRTPTIDPAVKSRLFKRLEKDGIGIVDVAPTNTASCL
ncbi:hypothetical protein LOTGIDRAFT_197767 [Lottia gigantea]|uniref:Apolipoprotein D n=1 Tax=Lottia gigantea TaxID=225164 RepID=V4B3K6_LOTGI|nr:hypothetical protein LOTGIDRAFT_197767 [Lottia gigantea]ESO82949.1 hypothetical protein LOTGIDRAFT_197767 [Lottia gigantea]